MTDRPQGYIIYESFQYMATEAIPEFKVYELAKV